MQNKADRFWYFVTEHQRQIIINRKAIDMVEPMVKPMAKAGSSEIVGYILCLYSGHDNYSMLTNEPLNPSFDEVMEWLNYRGPYASF